MLLLSSSERSSLIRLAASLPKGSEERRAIISSVVSGASRFRVGQRVRAKRDTYLGVGRDATFVREGTLAKVIKEDEDDDGKFYFLTISIVPNQFADDQRPYKLTQSVPESDMNQNWERA